MVASFNGDNHLISLVCEQSSSCWRKVGHGKLFKMIMTCNLELLYFMRGKGI